MSKNVSLKTWIKAARLRSLPLAFSSIFLGSALAYFYGKFELNILLLALLTTLCLQILSNFANDYGDSIHGADHSERKGPSRAVQSGEISLKSMKNAMILFTVLSFVFGFFLLILSFGFSSISFYVFVFLLLVSIFAAINYTSGKNPYGYKALGDVSVFIFFGVFGVSLNCYLHLSEWSWMSLLPASAVGLMSVAVLNLNNMRDMKSDALAGKKTVAMALGFEASKWYQYVLIVTPFLLIGLFLYVEIQYIKSIHLLFLLAFPLALKHLIQVAKVKDIQDYDPMLKIVALNTLLLCLSLSFSLI